MSLALYIVKMYVCVFWAEREIEVQQAKENLMSAFVSGVPKKN